MSAVLLLRLVRKTTWTGKSDPSGGMRAREDFKIRESDTDGISIYEVDGCVAYSNVIAGLACTKCKTDTIDFLGIPRTMIHGKMDDTLGETPIPAANSLHRSLAWSQPQLDKLADDLYAAHLEAWRVSTPTVRVVLKNLKPSDIIAGPKGDDARKFLESL